MIFEDTPLEIGVKRDAKISIFIDFQINVKYEMVILKFIDKFTSIESIIRNLGDPDFSRNELDGKPNKMIKYYFGKFSMAIIYEGEAILLICIFEDEFR